MQVFLKKITLAKVILLAWFMFILAGSYLYAPIAIPEFSPSISKNKIVVRFITSADCTWLVLKGSDDLEKANPNRPEVNFSCIHLKGNEVKDQLNINAIAVLNYDFLVEGKTIGFIDSDPHFSAPNKTKLPIFQVSKWSPAGYLPRVEMETRHLTLAIMILLFFLFLLIAPTLTIFYYARKPK